MTDYMKEAERLTDEQIKALLNEIEYGNMVTFDGYAYLIARKIEWHVRAALLEHFQRGAPDGWKEATIAWEVCASIHREYAKKKDPFFSTRQADFVRHTEAARAAMLAHIQRGAVPEGYDIAPTFRGYAKLGSGHYVLHNCPRTDEDHPSLVIAIATEEEKAGRQVGELRQSQPGLMIQPERIAVRIDFKSVAALDALEQQLRFLREDSFPDSLTAAAPDHFRDAAEMVAEPAKVPMPQVRWATCPETDTPCSHCPTKRIPCQAMTAPAEVPMPDVFMYGVKEPDGGAWMQEVCVSTLKGDVDELVDDLNEGREDADTRYTSVALVTTEDAKRYAAACRAAGEAAGYARGLKEAGRDAAADGNERAEWEGAVFTLMGHAAGLYANGQNDIPNWIYELAEKIARQHADEALAARVREVGIQQRAELAAALRGEVKP